MMVSSSRPNRTGSASGRFPKAASNDTSATLAETALSHQHSIRSYFSPIPLSKANSTHTAQVKEGKAKALETRTSHQNHTLPSAEIPDRELPTAPTKLVVAQPHGKLLQTTNGVRTRLEFTEDDIPSESSTPRPDTLNETASRSAVKTSKETRTLRSKDGGSRLKSDLSIYFGNYEDVIADAPKEQEYLRNDEPIYIIDEPSKEVIGASAGKSRQAPVPSRPKLAPAIPPTVPPSPHADLKNAKMIDLSAIPSSASRSTADPLPDALYFKPHRRAERKEKQLRNIEKERAQHEKVQLERILEGLQGPDWLRVLGVTGVTEGEQKDWKPKRDYFIGEVSALVDKFRHWKDEEKRLKLEKERAKEEEEAEEDEDEEDEEESASAGADSSDIDASAARQLQLEAGITPRLVPRRKRQPPESLQPPSPEGPFVSFYSKPHLRAAAMGKGRHGRNVTAFGHPLPDLEEQEFALPDDYVTPEALRANARKRRRLNRELKEAEQS